MTATAISATAEGVARVTLDAPPLNILTRAVLGTIREHLDRIEHDDATRVVVLQATGRHFSAGADVGEHLPPDVDRLIPEFLATVQRIYAFPLPIIVAVQGRCLGAGMELAVAGDIIVAAETAVFGQPEIQLGVSPPAACVLLPTVCPPGVAADLILGGDPIDAVEAHRIGLVRRVVPEAQLADAATDTATRLARHSRAALRCTKRALRVGTIQPMAAAFDRVDTVYRQELMQTADAVEGLTAFLEKRPPRWSHR